MNCRVCKNTKSLDRFYYIKNTKKYDSKCNDCKNEYKKERQRENPEAFKKAMAKWYKTKGKKWRKKYENDNKDKINERERLRYKNDPVYRNKKILRNRLSSTINGKKVYNKVLDQLAIPHEIFLEWLEFQFTEEMNWENQGSYWTIDHIVPIDYFVKNKLNNNEMNHWSNLRPQYGPNNYSKNNKIDKNLINEHYTVTVPSFIGLKDLEIDTIVQRLQRKWA
jgi:hypothetical protein